MSHDVFVSYSQKDKAIADTIVAALERNHVRCWYAPRDIKPSDDWGDAISKAIEKSRIFLIVFSGSANRSRHVLDELILAVDEEVAVLPLRVENLEPRGAMRLHLSSRHWLDAYDPSWEDHIQRLVQTVCANLNIPYEKDAAKASEKVVPLPQNTDKKNFTRYIAIAGFGAALLVSGWFMWNQFLRGPSARQESEPAASETSTARPTQEAQQVQSPLRVWNEECWIAYVSQLEDSFSIWLMHPDGTNQIPITDAIDDDIYPKWSIDGNRIAFLSQGVDENNEIYIIDKNGENHKQFSEKSNDTEYYNQFVWSPVSEQIAYVSEENGDADIYITESGGSTAITSDPASDTSPAWSPDGKQIAFVTEREGNKDIFVIDADGENLNQLTQDSASDIEPTWSPNGERIAFSSDRNGRFDIFVMNTDGSGLTQLTDLGNDRYPTWSNDGNKIAFYSDRSGGLDVYMINQDGSEIGRLIDSENKELFSEPSSLYFDWSPDGKEMMVSQDNRIYRIPAIRNAYLDNYQTLAEGWYPVWSPLCEREAVE